MTIFRVTFAPAAVALLLVAFIAGSSLAQSPAPGPGPGPTSDGMSIDQGIAYLLILVALILTYLIHPHDELSSSFKFF